MRNPFRKRWMLEKYDRRDADQVLKVDPPAPACYKYWTYSGALADEVRLNSAQMQAGRPWRFRIVRLP